MMKMNLRKASQVQNSIRSAISERQSIVTGRMDIPLWRAGDEQIAVERVRQLDALSDITRLEGILSAIREKTGAENVKNGVNALLAEQSTVQANIGRLTRLVKSDSSPSTSELESRVSIQKEQAQKAIYGGNNDIAVGVFSLKDLEKMQSNLLSFRRRLAEIGDQLIAANLASTISISDNDAKWMEDKGII